MSSLRKFFESSLLAKRRKSDTKTVPQACHSLGTGFHRESSSQSMPRNPRSRPQISALLIDVSGNLHVGENPTPGAVDALRRLVAAGIPFRLCSNTSKESTADLIKRLDGLGFGISDAERNVSRGGLRNSEATVKGEPDEGSHRTPRLVWTSIGAVAQALGNTGAISPYLLLSDSAQDEVLNSLPNSTRSDDAEYDSVVVGLAPTSFTYGNLNQAFRILKGETGGSSGFRLDGSSPPPLIATHRAKYIHSSDGNLSLGPGPFIAALENAAGPGVNAIVVGKPEATFFQMVIDDFGFGDLDTCDDKGDWQAKVAVIGDDVEADLGGGAVELGLWRVLVKTGKYRQGDETRPGVVPPDEVFDSFSAFVDSFLEGKTSKGRE